MRYLTYCILSFSLFTFCKTRSQTNDITSLETEICTFTFSLPSNFDTAYYWTDFSDCNTCHISKYRFQGKAYSIQKETGMYLNMNENIELDRLTVRHMKDLPFRVSKNEIDSITHNHNLLKFCNEFDVNEVSFDTMIVLKDRFISLYDIRKTFKNTYQIVIATIYIKGNQFDFIFEKRLLNKHINNDDYRKLSLSIIKSLRVIEK